MKKYLSVFVCACLLLALSACGGGKPTYRSIYDTETKTSLSLGDPKSKFDKDLGESELAPDMENCYVYLNESLFVQFTDDDTAFYIAAVNMGDVNAVAQRFTFPEFDFIMSAAEIQAEYELLSETGTSEIYAKYFDTTGRSTTSAQAVYVITVHVNIEAQVPTMFTLSKTGYF